MVIVTLGSKKVKEAQVSKFGFNDFLPALKQFIQNKNFVVILLLIAFFRLSDTVLGYMAYPFYTDVGFTGNDLAVNNIILLLLLLELFLPLSCKKHRF